MQAINAPRYPNATQQVGNPAREPLAATQIAKLRSPELAVHRRRTAAHHSLGPGGGSERATGSPLGAQPRGAEEGVEAEPPRPAAGARGVFSRCATAGRCRGDRSAAVATAPSIPPAGPGRPAATRHGGWGEGTSLLLLIVITIKVCRTLGRDESAGAKAPVTTGGWERAPPGLPAAPLLCGGGHPAGQGEQAALATSGSPRHPFSLHARANVPGGGGAPAPPRSPRPLPPRQRPGSRGRAAAAGRDDLAEKFIIRPGKQALPQGARRWEGGRREEGCAGLPSPLRG